ncbi:MAG: hypothetical protein GAKPKEKM_02293 [Rhodocyclaceae bacterium]|nr:hypothetical protein [Rhodocyclaceae bacterium]
MEGGDGFIQDGIGVAMVRVEAGAREHGQAVAQAGRGLRVAGALDRPRMQGEQNRGEARILAHQQPVDARILEELDGEALEGAPVVGDLRRRPAPMADHVRQRRAVAVEAADAGARVVDVGQAHAEPVVVGHDPAQRVVGVGVGNQRLRVAPQRAQIQVEAALGVGEQRAVALALQHGAAVGERQLEIVLLLLRMVAVVADAVVDPVLQPGHRQLLDQLRRLAEEDRQAGAGEGGVAAVDGAGGARHQLARDVEIEGQLLARGEAARHRRQRLQQGRDGVSVGRGLQGARRGHDVLQRGGADGGRRRGPGLEEGQHRLRSAAEAAERFRRRHVVVHLPFREGGQRLVKAFLEDVGHRREAAVHLAPPGLHLRMMHCTLSCIDGAVRGHGFAVPWGLTFRRRSRRPRGRAWRGCRRRR